MTCHDTDLAAAVQASFQLALATAESKMSKWKDCKWVFVNAMFAPAGEALLLSGTFL